MTREEILIKQAALSKAIKIDKEITKIKAQQEALYDKTKSIQLISNSKISGSTLLTLDIETQSDLITEILDIINKDLKAKCDNLEVELNLL